MTFTDPEVRYARLACGDVGRIAAAAEPITAAIGALRRARGSIDAGTGTSASTWSGAAADAFAIRAAHSATATENARGRLNQAVTVVQAAATAYGLMRQSADGAIRAWRARPPDLDPAALRQFADQINTALGAVREGYESALRSYARSLGAVRPAFAETAGDTPAWQATTPQTAGAAVPPPGSDPRQVARWWAGLNEIQRDQLLATRFDEVGRLRGLPADVLNSANRTRLAVDRQRFDSRLGSVTSQITARTADPVVQASLDQLEARYRDLGIPFDRTSEEALRLTNDRQLADLLDQRSEAARGLQNATDARHSLHTAENLAADRGITDGVRVLAWDPTGARGDGAMAIAYGNPDTAANVAVSVPGTGSTLGGFSLDQAANLRQEMDGVAGSGSNATIQWLGYDAPTWSPDQVAGPLRAQEGGANLVADVTGYRAAAEAAGNTAHVTVIGHSYGSVTVGYAGMNGLAADDLAVVGSPGVGASNVDQLASGAGHVFVGGLEHDPVIQVTGGTWFTEDGSSTGPYDDSFGATRFGTDDPAALIDAHSSYYDQGSESLDNLAKIATGNGSQVSGTSWLDDPLGPEVPGSDLPVIGPVIDAGAQVVKEGVDLVTEAGGGLVDTVDDAGHGRWGEAAETLWDTVTEAGGDLGDVGIAVLGDAASVGREGAQVIIEGADTVWDNTLGRIF